MLQLPEPIELYPEAGDSRKDFVARTRPCRRYYGRLTGSKKLCIGLLRVCKTIHQEAAEVFYGENEFRFSGINGHVVAFAFTHTIGFRHLKFLKTLTIAMPLWSGGHGSYNDDLNIDGVAAMWRLSERIRPLCMPHNGGWYFDKALDLLVRKLVNHTDLKELKLVLPNWFEYDQNKNQSTLWKATDKLLAVKSDLYVEVTYLCDSDTDFRDMKGNQRWLVKELKKRGIGKFNFACYEEKGRWKTVDDADKFDAFISSLWVLARELDERIEAGVTGSI